MTRKIIIDTDIGIDDAVAILMALRNRDLHILAITCCPGNTVISNVVHNAVGLLTHFGRNDIPVGCGLEQPLGGKLFIAPEIHGNNGLGEFNFSYYDFSLVSPLPAHELIYKKIIDEPGKVDILALGALTNVALMLRAHSKIKEKINSIYFMGGAFRKGTINSAVSVNIAHDVMAASEVFQSGIQIYACGTDVTRFSCLTTTEFERFRSSGKTLNLFNSFFVAD